jgi:hypothetical protein
MSIRSFENKSSFGSSLFIPSLFDWGLLVSICSTDRYSPRWTGRVSFEEMAVSRSLVKSLESGLRKWGQTNKTK